ncbi:MAG: fluoride efflux transporter CrcB [Actinomycetota bacterium]|nr:fluoride efflux transporter CrcB [Actinomycetota bacterium]
MRAIDVAGVALGAGVGGALRFVIGAWLLARWEHGYPWHTFAINITGAFLLGVLAAVSIDRGLVGQSWQLLLGAGLLGGFTTFSTFSFETLTLLTQGRVVPGLLYAGVSTVLGVAAAGLGLLLGRTLG